MKKIHFKSTYKSFKDDKDNVIEFITDLETEFENNFNVLSFNEIRENKKISNRIEYNNDELKIFSGVSSLSCKLNQIVKNNFIVPSLESHTFFIYTKLNEIIISDDNNLIFRYYTSHNDKFDEYTSIELDLKIIEN